LFYKFFCIVNRKGSTCTPKNLQKVIFLRSKNTSNLALANQDISTNSDFFEKTKTFLCHGVLKVAHIEN
jgi:hypothetical protein